MLYCCIASEIETILSLMTLVITTMHIISRYLRTNSFEWQQHNDIVMGAHTSRATTAHISTDMIMMRFRGSSKCTKLTHLCSAWTCRSARSLQRYCCPQACPGRQHACIHRRHPSPRSRATSARKRTMCHGPRQRDKGWLTKLLTFPWYKDRLCQNRIWW